MPAPGTKPPAPMSFYQNVAQMGASGGAGGPGAGGGDGKKPAGQDEIEIVKTLFRVFEKWRKLAGGDQEKTGLIQTMADALQKYDEKFVKSNAAGGGAEKEPPPSADPGAGAAPGGGAGAAPPESQAVPA